MFKKYKFTIGLTLLVQSASFIVLFFLLYKKKKSLANTFLALSAIGGIAGAYLVLKEAKDEVEACELAAKDAYEYDDFDEFDDEFDFGECENCYGDCSECFGTPKAQTSCEITVESDDEEALDEVVIEEEPAEDIFTSTVEA